MATTKSGRTIYNSVEISSILTEKNYKLFLPNLLHVNLYNLFIQVVLSFQYFMFKIQDYNKKCLKGSDT